MSTHHLAVQMGFTSQRPTTDDEFEAFLDDVYARFEEFNREVHLSARLADRTASFGATVEADEFEDAVNALLGDMRTALHAAGCYTGGWPSFQPTNRTVSELQDA